MDIFKMTSRVILIKEITVFEKHFRDQMKLSSLNLFFNFKVRLAITTASLLCYIANLILLPIKNRTNRLLTI